MWCWDEKGCFFISWQMICSYLVFVRIGTRGNWQTVREFSLSKIIHGCQRGGQVLSRRSFPLSLIWDPHTSLLYTGLHILTKSLHWPFGKPKMHHHWCAHCVPLWSRKCSSSAALSCMSTCTHVKIWHQYEVSNLENPKKKEHEIHEFCVTFKYI